MGETVVLDSSDLAGVVADATGVEPPAPPPEPVKPRARKEASEPKGEPDEDDGLTDEERNELTRKMQKAVGRRHRQMREAQEQAQREQTGRKAAEDRAKQLEEELAKLRSGERVEPRKVEESQEPKPENFETTEAYMAARVKWEVGQELERERRERREAEARKEQERIVSAARERIAKAIELVPDFQEVTEAADLEVPGHIAAEMQESELFAELGYYFAKHPDELERIAAMRPGRGILELGKIESRLKPFGEKPKVNGEKPSTKTDVSPSRPRIQAPIVTPLNVRGSPQVEEPDTSVRDSVASFQRRTGANLKGRSRH